MIVVSGSFDIMSAMTNSTLEVNYYIKLEAESRKSSYTVSLPSTGQVHAWSIAFIQA